MANTNFLHTPTINTPGQFLWSVTPATAVFSEADPLLLNAEINLFLESLAEPVQSHTRYFVHDIKFPTATTAFVFYSRYERD